MKDSFHFSIMDWGYSFGIWLLWDWCSYQIEALEKAIKQNTIVFLETGSGKTLIAIMLLRYYAHLLRKPSPFIAVFLVPKVVLVPQVYRKGKKILYTYIF